MLTKPKSASGMRVFRGVAADLAECIGFANLCVLNLWQDIQRLQSTSVNYFRDRPSGGTVFAGTVLLVLAAGLVFFLLQQVSRRFLPVRVRHGIFVAACLVPACRSPYIAETIQAGPAAAVFFKACAFVLVAVVCWSAAAQLLFGADRPFRIASTVNRLLSPLLLISIATYLFAVPRNAAGFEVPAQRAEGAPHPAERRVIWVVFDELAFSLAFPERPRTLQLPALDRLRNESFFATAAHAPGDETLRSMPALIDGAPYYFAEAAGTSELRVAAPGETPHPWTGERSVFAALSKRGQRTALAGWHHPYCRVLGAWLTECAAVGSGNTPALVREAYADRLGAVRTAWYLAGEQIGNLPLTAALVPPDVHALGRAEQLREFTRIHERAVAMAENPSLAFILIHYPIPHPYGIYDRRTGRLDAFADSSYIDNLALVDRLVSGLEARLRGAGLEDRTSLIISADHAIRKNLWTPWFLGTDPAAATKDQRIPFIVKLAGDATGPVEHAAPLNTVITKELALAIVDGTVTTAADLARWLRSR